MGILKIREPKKVRTQKMRTDNRSKEEDEEDKLFYPNKKDNNPFYVYSKEVKGKEIRDKKITNEENKEKVLNVIESLLDTGSKKYMEELDLSDNCVDLINSILSKYPDVKRKDVVFLLRDFTDAMYTSMRQEDKYAIAIVMKDSLILCHSVFGEKTITPGWRVIERMVDKDNVTRYVYFELDKNRIKIKFYEHTKSLFLVDWLGLPENEAFYYLGGKNRFFTELHNSNLVFEFTDDDIERKILENGPFKIEKNQIILPEPIRRINITQIRVGKKIYKNTGDFIQDFLAKRYDIKYYQESYVALKSSLDPLTTRMIDDESEVRSIDNRYLLKKRNDHFLILFCDKDIEIRKSFLEKIKTKILNREHLKIFHAGMIFNQYPIKINNLEIYNHLELGSAGFLINYYDEIEIKDTFDNIFLYLIFCILKQGNKNVPISHFLGELGNNIIDDINLTSKFVNLENKIEFKSRDFISGNNKEIIKRLKGDIETKMQSSDFKVYILGADETTKKFEPIASSRWSDDRIGVIENKLKEEMQNLNLKIIKIPSQDGSECILACSVNKK